MEVCNDCKVDICGSMVKCVADVSIVAYVVDVGASGVVVSRGVSVEDPAVADVSDVIVVDGIGGVGVGQGSLPSITVWLIQIA